MPEFDPDKYLASTPDQGFDPDAYMAAHKETPTAVEAGLRGAAQGATFGFGDELVGGGKALYNIATSPEKHLADYPELYQQKREEERQANEEAQKAHPWAYGGGIAAGSLAPALIPGLGEGEAAAGGLAATAGRAAQLKKAAAIGATAGYGFSNADPTKNVSEVGQTLKDIGTGAAAGAVGEAVAPAVGNYLTKDLPESLQETAAARAVKATGANKKDLKNMAKMGQVGSRGADLLAADEAGAPVIGWTSKAQDVAPAAAAKKDFYGQKIGEVGAAIDAEAGGHVSGEAIRDKILDYAAKIPETPKNESIINNLLKEAQYYEKQGAMTFEDAQKHKGTYTFKPTDSTTQVLGQDATNAVRGIVSDEMDNAAKRLVADPSVSMDTKNLLEQYQNYKQKYGSFAGAEKSASDKVAANFNNRTPSPSDYAVGLMSGMGSQVTHGNPLEAAVVGAAGGALNKVARERGSAFTARAAQAASQALANAPEVLGRYEPILSSALKRGGASFAVTNELLMRKDPEYANIINKLQGDNK